MIGKFRLFPGGKGDLQPIIVETLRRMKTRLGVCGLKLSTEDAAMTLDQIAYWSELCGGLLPVVVKIGGPNARNDIRKMVELKVDGLIAPMVESAFGLENYIEALREYSTPTYFKLLEKHINIETVTAVDQLDSILDSPFIRHISEITIGRKDLSRSMNCPVEDLEVDTLVQNIVQKARSRKIPVSIGGGITPETIDCILKKHSLNKFNTRILTFAVDSRSSYRETVYAALDFEIMALKNDVTRGFLSPDESNYRIIELRKRLINSR